MSQIWDFHYYNTNNKMGNNASSGEKAYSIKLTDKYKLGEGMFGEVYKIRSKNKK